VSFQKKDFMSIKTSAAAILAFSFTLIILQACKKDKEAEGTDKVLYDLVNSTTSRVWYKFSEDLLDMSAGSGHSQPFLRTWYNAVAANQLDSEGKIKAEAKFGEGSLIVKELLDANQNIDLYAILYKDAGNSDADSKGWVWGYLNPDGTVRISAGNKGAQCISCHSQSENIDYMLMNKFFP
jgi:hypothetical protein